MLSQLTSALRSESGDEDSLFGGGESDLPRQMFGEQLAISMAKSGGIGIAEVIARELNPTKGESSAPASAINSAIETARHLRGPLPAQPPIDELPGKSIIPKPIDELPLMDVTPKSLDRFDDTAIRNAAPEPTDPLLQMTRPRRVSDVVKALASPAENAVKLAPVDETNAVKLAPINESNAVKLAPMVEIKAIKKTSELSASPLATLSLTGQPRVDEIIQRASARHGVNPHLLAAILRTESSGRQTAVSHKGASGYMQMMPATFKEFAEPGQSIFNAEHNIGAGASYLKHLSDKYDGRLDKILAAYNAGPGNVDKFGGVPPFRETRNFVATVKRRYTESLAAAEPAAARNIASNKGLEVNASRVKYEVASAQPNAISGARASDVIPQSRRAERQVIVLRNDSTEISSVSDAPVDLQIPVQGRISSPYGARRSHGNHKGVDIAAPKGSPIEASGSGEVVFAGWSRGYGKTVLIKHQDGVYTRYAHAEDILVSRGDTVQAGQQVATVGETGHATGPHLHFEVIKGRQRVNPMLAMADNSSQRVAVKIGK